MTRFKSFVGGILYLFLGGGCLLRQGDQPVSELCFATVNCTCTCTVCDARADGGCVQTFLRPEEAVSCAAIDNFSRQACGRIVAGAVDAGPLQADGGNVLNRICAEACTADLRIVESDVLECTTNTATFASNRVECIQRRADPLLSTRANGSPLSDRLICETPNSQIIVVQRDGRGNVVGEARAHVTCDVQVQRTSFDLTLVRVRGAESLIFDGGRTIDDFALSLVAPLGGSRDDAGRYGFEGPIGLFAATGTVDGTYQAAGARPQGDITGVYTLSTGRFTTGISLESEDHRLEMFVFLNGHSVNRAPIARIRPTGPVECADGLGAVELDGRDSTDPDAVSLVDYRWYRGSEFLGSGPVLTTRLPLGSHQITLLVFDGSSYGRTTTTVEVQDTQPPQVRLRFLPGCLWPPNHRMAKYSLGSSAIASVLDACDPSPRIIGFTDVQNSEPDDGAGDGRTAGDAIHGDDFVCVRAERSGQSKAGRVYRVTAAAMDRAGNVGRGTGIVTVNHDQRGAARCASPDPLAVSDPECLPAPSDPGPPAAGEQPNGCAAVPALLPVALAVTVVRSLRRRRKQP